MCAPELTSCFPFLSFLPLSAVGPFSYEVRAPFLNYLQNLRSRTQSGPRVRVGGNSQEGKLSSTLAALAPFDFPLFRSCSPPRVPLSRRFLDVRFGRTPSESGRVGSFVRLSLVSQSV